MNRYIKNVRGTWGSRNLEENEMVHDITMKWIDIKYGNPSLIALKKFRKEVVDAKAFLQNEMENVYRYGPKVHGAAQASRLDLLSKRSGEMDMLKQNLDKMINSGKYK